VKKEKKISNFTYAKVSREYGMLNQTQDKRPENRKKHWALDICH